LTGFPKKKNVKQMEKEVQEEVCFIIFITGLNRPNTGKDYDGYEFFQN
jgi:hypothetical protein